MGDGLLAEAAKSLPLTRRELLRALFAGAGLANVVPLRAAAYWSELPPAAPRVVAESAALGDELPVQSRRVLIPAPGATLPALLLRPAAPGRFPAAILSTWAAHDEAALRRQAAQGRVLLIPLSVRTQADARAALERYLRAHPAVLIAS